MNKSAAEPTGERLSKRVMALRQCSRSEAERYIAGGWVRVNGVVVEDPPHRVRDETVTIDPKASLLNLGEATFVLHKPEGCEDGTREVPPPDDPRRLLLGAQRSPDDRSGEPLLKRHLAGLQVPVPLEYAASGLLVFSQDWRVQRKLSEDLAQMEHEFIVDVQGEVAPNALLPIARALKDAARGLPAAKISVGSSTPARSKLRLAVKGAHLGLAEYLCALVPLRILGLRRIRLGRVGLGELAPGQWRFLGEGERF